MLHFDAFELHILEGRIKMGVHGGNNIDSVLFQFIPDAFLMQGSPGSSSAVEGDGDAVISGSQKLFFLLGEPDAVRRYGVFTERSVVDDPGGIAQNQLYICVVGQRCAGEVVDLVKECLRGEF